MPKKFFVIKQITRKEYFAMAEAGGKLELPKWVDHSVSGSMQLDDKKTYLAYTEEDSLEVSLEGGD